MENKEAKISAKRKDEHVEFALEQAANRSAQNDFDDIQFIHHALDAIDVDTVSLKTKVLGTVWQAPIYINAMTGGTSKTGQINADLAIAARETGVALASGSLSPIFKDIETIKTFDVLRKNNPEGFIFANINANMSAKDAMRAVSVLEADALQIHINSVQELTMAEGDRRFSHWAENIRNIVNSVEVPVIVKEVGFGISLKTAKKLHSLGVRNIDVAGRGGTNFALIEQSRDTKNVMPEISSWGLSTVQSLLQNYKFADTDTAFFSSGGIRNAMDVAKSLALGAKAVGVAGGFLRVLNERGIAGLIEEIQHWKDTLIAVQALLGVADPSAFLETQFFVSDKTAEFCEAMNINKNTFTLR